MSSLIEDVGVNHRRAHITVPEQLLDRADVVAGFEQMCRKGMTQRVTRGRSGDPRNLDRLLHRALDDGLVQVMPSPLAGRVVDVALRPLR
jgi:hypothetical protein